MLENARHRPEVTAVVVTCAVTPYLRRTLEGIAAQTMRPTRLVIVDVHSQGRDIGTGEDIRGIATELGLDAGTMVRVLRAPEATNFGDAVKRGLLLNTEAQKRADQLHETRTGEVPIVHSDTSAGWLWLLHDDSAPEPSALEELVRVGESGPSIGIAGAKQLDWDRENHLLEVGIQATHSARRFNPIDEDEIDQGQHDSVDDVLAVGLAGAIIRRDVWARLEGTDPALGPFGDGLELSRRARLAGYRVVIVPQAAVHHARVSYQGLRSYGHGPVKHTTPDIARSFGARRRAQLYNWLLAVRGWQVPLLALGILVLTPLRALARFVMKDMTRASAELSAGFTVLSRPDLWMAGRRRISATQVLPTSRLAELEVPPAEIRRKKREQRRVATEARKLVEAPSELELRERAQLADRRRFTGIGLTVLVSALAAFGLSRFLGEGQLIGGALLPSSARLGEIFQLVTSGWIPAGNGSPGPADPFWSLGLLPLLSGISLGSAATALLLLALPLAAVGAWFAAGTVTRSIGLRVWAAVLWTFAPTLQFAVLQGRLGATLTHVLLPFLLIALRRATGHARRDVILSGMVGARRVVHTGADDDATAATTTRNPAATTEAAVITEGPPPAVEAAAVDQATFADGPPPAVEAAAVDQATFADGPPPAVEGPDEPETIAIPAPVDPISTNRPSLGAGAAAALLLAAISAATPALLPLGVLLWLLLLLTPARRTTWFLPLPALALLAPLLIEIVRTGEWELLAAGPGVPFGYEPATPLATLFGFPAAVELGALPEWFTWLWWGPAAFALLIAVLAFFRPSFRARTVRAGWTIAVLGLALALAAPHVAVALDPTGSIVRAWPGAGISLALLGILLAALAGSDAMPDLLSRHQFGWRHISAALLTGVAAASALVAAGVWLVTIRADIPEFHALTPADREYTPAVAAQLANSQERARTLALTPDSEGGLTASLWRADGPQLHLSSTAVNARRIADPLAFTVAEIDDDAATDLGELASRLSMGVARTAGDDLAAHGIAVVVAPPAQDPVEEGQRSELVAALNATPGLARVGDTDAGTVWRVSTDDREGAAASVHRVTIHDATGRVIESLPSDPIGAQIEIPRGESNRLLVLTERSDPHWRLEVGGQRAPHAQNGWQQAFLLPANGGEASLTYAPPGRPYWLAAQVIVLGVTSLLAFPVRRRQEVE